MIENSEEKRILLKKFIIKKNIAEFESYIKKNATKLKELNDDHFDILIFSIEYGASLETIKLIINEGFYETLNYTLYNGLSDSHSYHNYRTPLLSAILSDNFKVANLLIKYKADINYKITNINNQSIHIIDYLILTHLITTKKLNFILNHGFNLKNITSDLIINIINYKKEIKNDLLEIMFRYYVFDNDFILSLLYNYKNKGILSKEQLHHMITKEKGKIKVNEAMYSTAIKNSYYKDNETLYTLLVYDKSEEANVFERVQHKGIIEIAILRNDYYLMEKILNYLPWRLNKNLDFEDIIIKAIRKEKYDILKLVINYLLHQSSFELGSLNFEKLLLEANKTKNINIMLLIIDTLIVQKSNIKLSFKEIIILADFYHYIHYNSNTIKEKIDNKSYEIIQFILKTLLSHSSINLKKNITLENILFMANFQGHMESFQFLIKNLINFKYINFDSKKINTEYGSISEGTDRDNFQDISKNRTKIINIFIESIVDITLKNFNQLEIELKENKIIPFLIHLLNLSIKLNNNKAIKMILENKHLRPYLENISSKGITDDYPLKVAYDHSKNEEIFNYLLEYGFDYNIKINQRTTLLKHAMQNRDYIKLKSILKRPLYIEDKDVINHRHPFPLMKAICHNKYNEVKSILTKIDYRLDCYSYMNMSVDYSKCPFTPLILSYLLGYQEIFNLLIKYADINDLDFYGYSLLHYVILKEDIDVINYLIGREVNVNYRENTLNYGHSALDIAITIGNKEIFYSLFNSKNILFSVRNKGNELPLSSLIKSEHFTVEEKKDMMKKLIEKGSFTNNFIDVNLPLKHAIQQNLLPLVKLLVENGANVNYIYERDGSTPLVTALEVKSFPIVKYLVENGADVNYVIPTEQDYLKKTILLRSIEIGELSIFEYLLEKNAAISFDNDQENYHIIQAISKSGTTEIFKYLVKHDLNSFSSYIIKSIISLNQLDLLKILISHNIKNNIRLKDKNGDTLLTYAIQYSNEYLLDYLIQWGADIHNINNNGETILVQSYKNSHKLRGQSIYQKIKQLF